MTLPISDDTDFDAVEAIFADFPWLAQLEGIYQLITDLVIADTPSAVIASRIRETDEYKERFSGMLLRQQEGYTPITEAEYMALEESYRNQLRDYGLLGYFATNEAELRAFAATQIGNDISAAEFSRRLDAGYAQVVDNGPLVLDAFEAFYGYRPSEELLLLQALDPERGLLEIENQLETLLIGSEAMRYGLNITRTRAEMLRASGVNRELARTGFADVARETPQLSALARMHNLSPLSQADLEEFVFHEDPNVARERFRIFETSLQEFAGSGAAPSTQGGVLLEFLDQDQSF